MTRLVGFGASTVQGAGDSEGGFFRRLERKLAAAGTPHQCLNHGVGGDSTRDMLARFQAVRNDLPGRAVILLGSNDIPRDRDPWPQNRVPLDEYEANVRMLLAPFVHPGAIFVSSFLICPRRTGMDPGTFARYLEAALRIAKSRALETWDLHAESCGFGEKYFSADGVHYNDAGHEFIAEGICRRMGSRWR
jgi:lysophospholipase L1-like esterase